MYRARTEPDLPRFADRVRPLLEQRPVEHNVLLTLLAAFGTAPASGGRHPAPLGVWVEQDDDVVGVGWYGPPWPLLLSRMPAAAVEALADHLASTMPGLEAVNGLEPQPATFAQRWQQRTGRGVSRRSPQRLYQLGELRAPVGVRGTSRPARLDELEQLSAWMEAFGVETHAVGVAARAELARLVEHGQLFVWEQAEAATSLAALRGPVAGVVRVSAVYTPPAHRRRGYASALIAAISRHALDEGAQACVLYTAANNPTSNAIYQAIGYRLVSEAGVYTFEAPAGLPAGEHGLGRALVPGQLAR